MTSDQLLDRIVKFAARYVSPCSQLVACRELVDIAYDVASAGHIPQMDQIHAELGLRELKPRAAGE